LWIPRRWSGIRAATNDTAKPARPGEEQGSLVEETDSSEALRRGWLSISSRAEIATYTVYAPVSLSDPRPHQIFFTPFMNRLCCKNSLAAQDIVAKTDSFPL